MNDQQHQHAKLHALFVSSRNVRAYCDGVWWEVTLDDPIMGHIQFDSYKAFLKYKPEV